MSAIAENAVPGGQPQPVPADIEAAVGQVITDLGAAFSGVLINIGRKLGLYKAMADLGPCSSQALAEATGVRERYVREWLNNQVAGGYARYDSEMFSATSWRRTSTRSGGPWSRRTGRRGAPPQSYS